MTRLYLVLAFCGLLFVGFCERVYWNAPADACQWPGAPACEVRR